MSEGEKESAISGLGASLESVSDHVPDLPDMASDCSRCAALCCAAFAFERSEMFALDKPVDVACPHLDVQFACDIHENRLAQGFRGCTLFDCHGAGQRVTQEIFSGRNWRNDPAIAAPMFEAFRKMLKIHDYLRLIAVLESLPLDADESRRVACFRDLLNPQGGWDRKRLEDFEAMRVITEFEIFAASLKSSRAAATLQSRFTGLKS